MKDIYCNDSIRMANHFIAAVQRLKKEDGACLVFLHRSVDGDCVGSACGTCAVLRNLRVTAYVAMPEVIPENMSFLGVDDLLFYPFDSGALAAEFAKNGTIDGRRIIQAVAVDCSDAGRMGICGDIYASCRERLVIDHHASIQTRADNMWIDPEASSACELCYYNAISIAARCGKPRNEVIGPLAAQCFMAGIVTDTGRFTYKNTHPETLTAAGELMELGAGISEVCFNLFDRKKKSKFMLSAIARSRVQFYAGGKLAVTVVPHELFEQCGAGDDGVDDVVSAMRDIDGVELAIVLRELGDGEIRANIRSCDVFNSAAFAENFGGGGHVRAAGFTLHNVDLNVLAEEVIGKATELL